MTRLALLVVCLSLTSPVFGQQDKYLDELKKHWNTSKAFTLAVAEAMPESGYASKPNAEEMSFAGVVIHIAQANVFYFERVSGQKSPLPAMEDKDADKADKATAIKMLTSSYDFCLKALDGLKAEDLDKMFRQSSGREVLLGAFIHTAHHRGQMEVYLRVKGIKPPDYKF